MCVRVGVGVGGCVLGVGRRGWGALKLTTASDHSGQSADDLYSPQKFTTGAHINTRARAHAGPSVLSLQGSRASKAYAVQTWSN